MTADAATIGHSLRGRTFGPAAIDHYRRSLAHDPGFAEADNNLGVALERSGRRVGAMVEFGHAIDLRPDYRDAYDNLARVVRAYERDPDPTASTRGAPSPTCASGWGLPDRATATS